MTYRENNERTTQASCLTALRAVLWLFPTTKRARNIPWDSLKAPAFPLLFSFLAGLLGSLPSLYDELVLLSLKESKMDLETALQTYLVDGCIIGFAFYALTNAILMGWGLLILKLVKRKECTIGDSFKGMRKAIYISAGYQPLLGFMVSLVGGKAYGMQYPYLSPVPSIALIGVMIGVTVLRFAAIVHGVEKGVNRGSKGMGIAVALGSLDLWLTGDLTVGICVIIWQGINY